MDVEYGENLAVYLKDESVVNHALHCEIAHKHNGIELIYTTKGKMKCQVGRDSFTLTQGDICFINKNQLHQISCMNKNECSHKSLIIDMTLLTQNQMIYEKYFKPLIEENSFAHVRFEGKSSPAALIRNYIEEIDKAQKESSLGYELEIIGRLHQIIRQVYISFCETENTKPRSNQHSLIEEEMVSFIEQNYSGQITLDDIANAGNVSRSQCIKIFKEFTGQSPISFLNSFRLDVSRDLLRNSDMSIADVSINCGFNGQSYFNRQFLRSAGCTPNEYRQRRRGASRNRTK